MGQACTHIHDERKDISSFQITTHAMSQYMAKCFLGDTMVEASQEMRDMMKNVRKAELNKKSRDNRVAYIDDNDTIYITDKNTVVTVFPNERIFVAKTMYGNRKMGHKYL